MHESDKVYMRPDLRVYTTSVMLGCRIDVGYRTRIDSAIADLCSDTG